MFKKLLSASLGILMSIAMVGCASKTKEENNNVSTLDKGKIQIVASFNPMKEFAEAIGKDKVAVISVVPDGTEPHDFEPKAKDMESINKAKIFIYNGLDMEEWAEKALEAVKNKELIVVEASKGVALIKAEEDDHAKDKKEESDEHGEFDPHVWLSLKEGKVIAKNVLDALIKVDEANKEYYEKNYNDFVLELDNLHKEYKVKFDSLKNKDFVTGHAAFAYFCRDFGLKQESVEGVFAEGEPTPQKLKELIEHAKKNSIKIIFMEELASPKVSETLAKEVGAKVEKIDTLESKEDGKNYIQSMRANLDKIYNSMK